MPFPAPEPGLVIHYAYLWHYEGRAGSKEGRKDRPGVIIFTVTDPDHHTTIVMVIPITHRAPSDPKTAIEIPAKIKKHLGLDDARSWIMLDESNEFIWPGYDMRKASGSEEYSFGFLPPRFFRKIRDSFVAFYKSGRVKRTRRS